MAHLFLSYAHKDKDRVYPIHERMEYELERCIWIDRKDLVDNVIWRNEIETGITTSDAVIFVITAEFVNLERKFIHEQEIPWAYNHFRSRQGIHLISILLDDVEVPDLLKTPHITKTIDARDRDIERVLSELKESISRHQEGQYPFIVSWPRLGNFKGRASQLIDLHQKLMGEGRVGVKTAGLYGTGGIGKTQLAVEYAHRYQSCYPAGVYWLNAAADWNKEIGDCAVNVDHSLNGQSSEKKALAFRDYLAKRNKDTLVVLDNVADPAEVTRREIAPLSAADAAR